MADLEGQFLPPDDDELLCTLFVSYGVADVEGFLDRLTKEKHTLLVGNVQEMFRIQSERAMLIDKTDTLAQDLGGLEQDLRKYDSQLNKVRAAIEVIELQNNRMENARVNNEKLLEVMSNLTRKLDFSSLLHDDLATASFDTEIPKLTTAINRLEALTKQQFPPHIASMACVKERLIEFQGIRERFVLRLVQHLKALQRKYVLEALARIHPKHGVPAWEPRDVLWAKVAPHLPFVAIARKWNFMDRELTLDYITNSRFVLQKEIQSFFSSARYCVKKSIMWDKGGIVNHSQGAASRLVCYVKEDVSATYSRHGQAQAAAFAATVRLTSERVAEEQILLRKFLCLDQQKEEPTDVMYMYMQGLFAFDEDSKHSSLRAEVENFCKKFRKYCGNESLVNCLSVIQSLSYDSKYFRCEVVEPMKTLFVEYVRQFAELQQEIIRREDVDVKKIFVSGSLLRFEELVRHIQQQNAELHCDNDQAAVLFYKPLVMVLFRTLEVNARKNTKYSDLFLLKNYAVFADRMKGFAGAVHLEHTSSGKDSRDEDQDSDMTDFTETTSHQGSRVSDEDARVVDSQTVEIFFHRYSVMATRKRQQHAARYIQSLLTSTFREISDFVTWVEETLKALPPSEVQFSSQYSPETVNGIVRLMDNEHISKQIGRLTQKFTKHFTRHDSRGASAVVRPNEIVPSTRLSSCTLLEYSNYLFHDVWGRVRRALLTMYQRFESHTQLCYKLIVRVSSQQMKSKLAL